MFQKILVAYDGSDRANRALAVGINLAQTHGAELWALAVQEGVPPFSAIIDETDEEKLFAEHQSGKLLETPQARAQEAGIEIKTMVRPGFPAKIILEVTKEGNFDLLLIGASGISGMWRFLGTTAEKVIRHALCSVVIVR